MNTDPIESFWFRENAIDDFRQQLNRLDTHFEDFGANTFVIDAAILGADNSENTIEWSLTGTGSPNPTAQDYSPEARIMKAAITAIQSEMKSICCEMLLTNRHILKQP